LQKRKIEPEKISAPAVAIRSAIAAAMSKSNRRSALLFGKKIDLTKALAWLQETNQRSVKDCCCPSYKGNSEIFS
jgi:hypothetical protein